LTDELKCWEKLVRLHEQGEWVVVKNLEIEQWGLIACTPFETAMKNH